MASSFALLLSLSLLLLAAAATATEFRVGGPAGWKPPSGHESETFNQWAARNRFQVGDSLYFKYEKNDSVLVVGREDYFGCATATPILRYSGGNTTVGFDRHGYFYFISGSAGHCRAGQKLVVRVMVQSDIFSPAPAPELPGWSGSADRLGPGHAGSSGSSGAVAAVASSVAVAAAVLSAGLGALVMG